MQLSQARQQPSYPQCELNRPGGRQPAWNVILYVLIHCGFILGEEVVNLLNIQGFLKSQTPTVTCEGGRGSSPRSSLSSSSALVGLMTPSTSKPAKLLTSLWIRLSCGGGGEGEPRGRHAEEGGEQEGRGEEAKPLKPDSHSCLKGIPWLFEDWKTGLLTYLLCSWKQSEWTLHCMFV